MDSYCEYMVRKKKSGRDAAMTILVILLALMVSYYVLGLGTAMIERGIPGLPNLMFPLIALVWWGAVKLIKRSNIEFEYSVTGSDLDVDKITNRKSRKRILNVSVRTFEITAPLKGGMFTEEYDKLPSVDASSSLKDENTYFSVYRKDGAKGVLFYNPSEKMLDTLKKFRPDSTFLN